MSQHDPADGLTRLIRAVQASRDHGVVLCHLEPGDVGRVVAALAVARERAHWTPGERFRHMERLARTGDE